jgi:branched-chain amino acid aminotransferase
VSLPFVAINGVAADAPSISVRDRGFTLADGLFETMRVQHGQVFRLARHLERLAGGLNRLKIPLDADLREWVTSAITQSGAIDASIRLTVTRGIGPAGLQPPETALPTVIVALNPMPSFPASIYEHGLRAVIASGRRNPRAMTAGLKTLSYTDAVVAWLEAERAGADEAILLDTDDHCSEATASNLFALYEGQLWTPPTRCAALPGVTRDAVLELARGFGIAIREEPFGLDRLTAAQEVFLTSSLRGIAPVTSLDGRPVGSGAPGEITQRVAFAYAMLVDRECATSARTQAAGGPV